MESDFALAPRVGGIVFGKHLHITPIWCAAFHFDTFAK
jgi:hypothetical protein